MKELEMKNGEVRDAKQPASICHACQQPGRGLVQGIDGELYHRECRKSVGK